MLLLAGAVPFVAVWGAVGRQWPGAWAWGVSAAIVSLLVIWATYSMDKPPSRTTRVTRWVLVLAPMAAMLGYAFLNIASQPTPSSDGMMHTLEIRQIAESGRLPSHSTYLVADSSPEQVTYRPVDYPNTFYLTGALSWLLGGVKGLYLLTALSAALTVLSAYLIVARLSRWLAGVVAALVLLVPLDRYAQIVLFEQLLLPTMLAALYFYGRALDAEQHDRWKYALLTGALIGLAVAMKQQAYILAAGLALHGTLSYAVHRVRALGPSLAPMALIGVAAVAVAVVPTAEVAVRNGSVFGSDFGFPKAIASVPFVSVKPVYRIDTQAATYLVEEAGLGAEYQSPIEVAHDLLHYPLDYGRGLWPVEAVGLPLTVALIAGACLASVFRRWRLLTVLLVVLIVEVFVAAWYGTEVRHYDQLGFVMVTMLLCVGAAETLRWAKGRGTRYAVPLVAAVLGMFSVIALSSWVARVHGATWGGTYAREHGRLAEYEEMGRFMGANVPQDSVTLGGYLGVVYYSRRPLLWVNWWGGADLPKVWKPGTTEAQALAVLRRHRVDYVLLDRRQTEREHAVDWIPPGGLLSSIDGWQRLEKVYETSQGTLVLYKVRYPADEAVIPSG